MLYVVGRWGAGTSLTAEIIRRHGFYFGKTEYPGWTIPGRNKYGLVEDIPVLDILRREEGNAALMSRLGEIIEEAAEEGLRPALKMPWILVRPEYWPTLDAFGTQAVFVSRSLASKPLDTYTMHPELQPKAVLMEGRLANRWDRQSLPRHWVHFDALIRAPEETIRPLVEFLDVPFEPSAVDAVDPNWMRNPL